jgi:hypothetical protein
LRAGNNASYFGNNQILFGYSGGAQYMHAIKSRHQSNSASGNAIDFYLWQNGQAIDAVGSLQAMTIENNAGSLRVGIGTSAADYTLDVNGNIRSRGNFYVGYGTSSDVVMYINSQNGSQSEIRSNTGVSAGYNGIMISANHNGANSLPSWSIDLGGAGNSTTNSNEFTVGYKPYGGSWTSRLRVNSSGNLTAAGNLTVGGNRLTISGTEGQVSFLDSAGVWTGTVGFSSNTGSLSFPGRNVEIVAGYNGSITLNNGASGYTSGSVNIPYGSLNVNSGNLNVTGTITASSTIGASNFSGTHSGTSSGTNTGDQTNISGNAATVSNLTAVQFFNNMGNTHSTWTDFNNITNFGFRYVQGSTNGPGTGSQQFYGVTLGLGDEYAFASYALQLAIPRYNFSSAGGGPDRYLSIRSRENTTWNSWQKIWAGYADSAGSVAWTNVSSRPTALSGFTNDLGNYGNWTVNGAYNVGFNCGFTSYTSDGLFNAASAPFTISTPSGNSRIRLGYNDYGGGQYYGRIGFQGPTNWSIGHVGSAGNNFSIGTNYNGTLIELTSSTLAFNGQIATNANGPSIYENRINAGYYSTGDTVDVWINYEGYLNGVSYFRDFRVGNGKQGAAILFIDGSANSAAFISGISRWRHHRIFIR